MGMAPDHYFFLSAEILFGQRKVIEHCLLGRIRIAAADGRQDIPVAGDRPFGARSAEGSLPREPHEVCQGLQQDAEDRILRGLGQQGMEPQIGVDPLVERSRPGQLPIHFLHCRHLVGRCALGGERGDGGFQLAADLDQMQERMIGALQKSGEAIDHVRGIGRLDARQFSLGDLDQSPRRESAWPHE